MVSSELKYYEIDQDGFLGVSYSIEELTTRLQWADVVEGAYLVIDSDGWFYEAEEDDDSEYGYKWCITDRQNVNIVMMLKERAHGEQLSSAELDFCR
ncbi:hypothetical protein ACFPK9_12890 [Rubritalea spongiae]|uniref:Uncharacterized protein n=1 Tax=Rubritalea spongiae TaxID=430797 RepID=A0ABW5E3R7_9BACT